MFRWKHSWPSSVSHENRIRLVFMSLINIIKSGFRGLEPTRLVGRFSRNTATQIGQKPTTYFTYDKNIILTPSKPSFFTMGVCIRAISHKSHEPWPLWNCESPKESVRRLSQHTSWIMQCGHGPSSVVRSRLWPCPQPNAISISFYSCGSLQMIK
jgi:hypothetical protein